MNEDCESAITDAKYGFISGALKETFTDNHLEQAQTTKVLDAIVTHRIWGYPIFFLFMYARIFLAFSLAFGRKNDERSSGIGNRNINQENSSGLIPSCLQAL